MVEAVQAIKGAPWVEVLEQGDNLAELIFEGG